MEGLGVTARSCTLRKVQIARLDDEAVKGRQVNAKSTVRRHRSDVPERTLRPHFESDDRVFTSRYRYSCPSKKDLTRMRSSLP